MSSPDISVIIPTFNRAEYVAQSVESVFAQTFTDHEVIVVDDGSTDDTRATLERFAHAPKFRYFHQANAGRSRARNTGIAQAKGEFLLFLDSDDLLLPDALKVLHEAARGDSSLGMIMGSCQVVDENMRELHVLKQRVAARDGGSAYASMIRERFCLVPGTYLVRQTCLRQVGLFDPATEPCEDYDLCLRLALGCRLASVDASTVRYRLHGGNTPTARIYRGGIRVARKHLEMIATSGDFAPALRKESHANWLLRIADNHYGMGENSQALRHYLHAFAVAPVKLLSPDMHRRILASLWPVSVREKLKAAFHLRGRSSNV
ncbi:MAG: glycosyltransferase family 2 protein [Acidobacteria bacterium]|nr:glycosyltransferase family 2 protein [Acidobacteriota bacterium]